MLGSEDRAKLGVSEDEAHALGLNNLRTTLKPLMEVAKVEGSESPLGCTASPRPSRLSRYGGAVGRRGAPIVGQPLPRSLPTVNDDSDQVDPLVRADPLQRQAASPLLTRTAHGKYIQWHRHHVLRSVCV